MAASNAGGKKPDPSEIAIDVEKAAEQLRRVMLSPRLASSLSATHPGEISRTHSTSVGFGDRARQHSCIKG